MRSRDADVDKRKDNDSSEDDSGDDDGDGAPPPYYSHSDLQHASDDKASLANSDDDKTDLIDDSLEELDPGAVWLDARKTDKGGTSIVRRTNGEVLYTMHKKKRWTVGNVLIFKGDVPQFPDSGGASTSTSPASPPPVPYVTLKQSSIYLQESSDPQAEPTKYKNRHFLRAPKWYSP